MSVAWYIQRSCEMLGIMSITAVIYYILANVKLMCELSDDGKSIYRNM
jgi:hypothetical protein